jgi:hypothetical protein
MSFFTGTPGAFKRLEGVPADTFSTAANYYKGLLGDNPSDFESFATPEMRRFKQQILPDIAEQFGGAGALSSSGFQNAASNAATDLSERLGALRASLRQSAAQGLTDIGSRGTYYQQGQPGLLDFAGPALGSVGSAFAGPALGRLGNAAGDWFVNRFKGSSAPQQDQEFR